jgi:hypothetical protein
MRSNQKTDFVNPCAFYLRGGTPEDPEEMTLMKLRGKVSATFSKSTMFED